MIRGTWAFLRLSGIYFRSLCSSSNSDTGLLHPSLKLRLTLTGGQAIKAISRSAAFFPETEPIKHKYLPDKSGFMCHNVNRAVLPNGFICTNTRRSLRAENGRIKHLSLNMAYGESTEKKNQNIAHSSNRGFGDFIQKGDFYTRCECNILASAENLFVLRLNTIYNKDSTVNSTLKVGIKLINVSPTVTETETIFPLNSVATVLIFFLKFDFPKLLHDESTFLSLESLISVHARSSQT